MQQRPVLLAVAAAATLVTSYFWGDAQPRPRPTHALVHDFGEVQQGEVVSHTFTVHNPLEKAVSIERVDCSVPGLSARFKSTLAPGHDGAIHVSWDTGAMDGEMQGQATVRFHDDQLPAVVLTLTGHVSTLLEVVPGRAAYFSVYQGETAQRRIRLVSHDAALLRIEKLEAHGTHFTASVADLPPGPEAAVDVVVPSGLAPGRFVESLVVRTNHPVVTEVRLAVNVLVKAHVHVSPEVVDFGQVSLSQLSRMPTLTELATQTVIIRKRQGPLTIHAISTDLPLSVDVFPSDDGSAFRLDFRLNPTELNPGPLQGVVEIETDDAEHPQLRVPVRGRVD
ncbi:MAG: DUF1573 domain-containing protein [Myxococcota bacterium]